MPNTTRNMARNTARTKPRGFTLIELLVVLAIIAMLVSIAAPRYFHSIERAKEASLHTSLVVMRGAIDQFAADKDRYPDSLAELVNAGYLKTLPEDPFTGSSESWVVVAPPSDSLRQGQIGDVHSGTSGTSEDGRLLSDW